MLTMFVLFVALYLTEREARTAIDLPVPSAPAPTALAADGPESVAVEEGPEQGLSAMEGVELTLGRTPRIVLTGDLLFESGVAKVRPEAIPLLEHVAKVIRWAPPHLRSIRVAGHSDDLPMQSDRFPSNWELSAARASAVARILIDVFSLEAGRFVISAYAHHHPLDAAPGSDARARNRRVEILLTGAEPGALRPF
jgi:chemotaxis protein MotB